MNRFLASSFNITAPLSIYVKLFSFTIRLLIRVRTNLSAKTGRSSSIISSEREHRPGLSVCISPTNGSSPTLLKPAEHSFVKREYANESRQFTGSVGGLRERLSNEKTFLFCRISSLNTPKYSAAALPSIPLIESLSSAVLIASRYVPILSAARRIFSQSV